MAGVIKNCPGADRAKGTPYIIERTCEKCGYVAELFSNEQSVVCPKCGADISSGIVKSAVFKGSAE